MKVTEPSKYEKVREMVRNGYSKEDIEGTINCNRRTLSRIYNEEATQKIEIPKEFLVQEKTDFVLITNNEQVLTAYRKMINK